MKKLLILLVTILCILAPTATIAEDVNTYEQELYAECLEYFHHAVSLYQAGDYAAAFPLAYEAAAANIPEAEYMVGYLYQHGLGTEVDLEWAFTFYLYAATDGYPEGMNAVAWCYQTGTGTEKDLEEVDYWMTKYTAITGGGQGTTANGGTTDNTTLIPVGQKAVVANTASLSVSGWEMLDTYSFVAGATSYDGDYTAISGAENQFIAVTLAYTNTSSSSYLYDEYITHVGLVYENTTISSVYAILQPEPSGNGYTDPTLLIDAGNSVTLIYMFTVPSDTANQGAPVAFSLRFDESPISFSLQ